MHAWDSAPQHGKTDITKNTKSFVHDWVRQTLKVRGAVFLPVREPDFNPVEMLFAFIKTAIRRKFPPEVGEVSVEKMVQLIDESFSEVTEEMVKGWLRYSCYVIPNDPQAAVVTSNDRCGYAMKTPPMFEKWHELIVQWERDNEQIPHIYRNILVQYARDEGLSSEFTQARRAYMGQYQTNRAYHIFRNNSEQLRTETPDYLDTPLDPSDTLPNKELNYKSEAYIELDKILKLSKMRSHSCINGTLRVASLNQSSRKS